MNSTDLDTTNIRIGDKVTWLHRSSRRPYLHAAVGIVVSISPYAPGTEAEVEVDGELDFVPVERLERVDNEHNFDFAVKPGGLDDIKVQAPIGVIRHPDTGEILFDANATPGPIEAVVDDWEHAQRWAGGYSAPELS